MCIAGSRGDNKRQSNQLGFLGLCFTFHILIRYNHNSPLPKTHKEGHPNEEWGAAMSAHQGDGESQFPFLLQHFHFSNTEQEHLMVEMLKRYLPIFPQQWWNGYFDSNVNLCPILSCNDLTAVTFIGTCPVTPQVESWGCTGISRHTPLQGMG